MCVEKPIHTKGATYTFFGDDAAPSFNYDIAPGDKFIFGVNRVYRDCRRDLRAGVSQCRPRRSRNLPAPRATARVPSWSRSSRSPSAACGGDTDDPASSSTSPASRSAPASGEGLPADVLDLSTWKLTLPVGPDDEDDAEEIKQPALATFRDDRYFTTTPATGPGWSSGHLSVEPPRPDRTIPAQSCARWTPAAPPRRAGRTPPGTHVLTVKQAITALPRQQGRGRRRTDPRRRRRRRHGPARAEATLRGSRRRGHRHP